MNNKRFCVLTVALTLVVFGSSLAFASSAIFWTAPNPSQEVFWTQMAEKFMAENPETQIQVMPMAEAPSSEATILTAVAGGTAPAASENIFIGFGAELYNSDALVPLDTLPGWEELLATRNMEEAIEGWAFPDGHYYILPIYSNPMMFGWRIDILEDMGYDKPPQTYSEIIEVGKHLREHDRRKFLLARHSLLEPTWWERWFDFFILYNAASQGQPFITGSEITADEAAAIGVFEFYQELFSNDLVLTRQSTDGFETALSIWSELGPWTFPGWEERFPEMVVGETFVLTPPPVPDNFPPEATINTFADAKGLVLYAQASEEATLAAWEFITWVYSEPENDLTWLEMTSLPPVRGDLATNQAFDDYLSASPALIPYAEHLANGVPPFTNHQFADIQTALSEEGLIPAIRGQKTAEQAWNDAKAAINRILSR